MLTQPPAPFLWEAAGPTPAGPTPAGPVRVLVAA